MGLTPPRSLLIFVCLLVTAISHRPLNAQDTTQWHGYQLLEFNVDKHSARLALPKLWHPQKHWIWRMRFWGHEPQVDIALLERGFGVAWIDLADLYGNKEAVELGHTFYDYLIKTYELHRKPVLEGFSRGGLMAYHWALANPEKVACIYADAPVLDIQSWPGGFGVGKGSELDWQKCQSAYGIGDGQINYQGVFERSDALVQNKIPLLHVCGQADSIVPYAENTGRLDQMLRTHGHSMEIILKAGVGHHPHSLSDPKPIIRFILQHTDPNLLLPDDLQEAPYAFELRSRWNQAIAKSHPQDTVDIAFLGGSITYGGGWRDSLMNYFHEKYTSQPIQFINAGIPSMGSTPGAFRLAKDVLSHGQIDLLFVEAAVNDATNGRSTQAQLRGMEGIVRHALRSNPSMDIILMYFADPDKLANYHRGETPEVIASHERVASHYELPSINLAMEVAKRILNGEFSWQHDFKDLHPSPFGHGIYARSMTHVLDTLMERGANAQISLPSPMDLFSYDRGKLLKITPDMSSGAWKYHASWQPADSLRTRPGFVQVPCLESAVSGAELSFDFTGRGIGILVPAGGDVGKIKYQIDQEPEKELDQFTRWSHFLHLPWLYMLADELSAGDHTLHLRISADKNAQSQGNACRIFAFAVNE